jgi:hypothetical protein
VKTLWTGVLRTMRVEATDPVTYWMTDGALDPDDQADDICLNTVLGENVTIRFDGAISCIACGRAIKKTFNQGFCYPCFRSRPEADICIVKPELCHFHEPENPCRDPDWGLAHCFKPHVLYASLTSGVKVGITRKRNIPKRWIDQGASAAMPLAELPNRLEVGQIEHRLASSGLQDKTHWMRMLKGSRPPEELDPKAEAIVARLESWGVDQILPPSERRRHDFTYPILDRPEKIKSLDLAKTSEVGGELAGIKGQYLILDSGVLNIRKFTGFHVHLSVSD